MPRTFINIILLLGAAVTGLFYFGPAWQEFRGLRRDIANLEEISAELDELLVSRDALVDAINQISKEELRRLDHALPQRANAAELLVALENIGGRSGVALKRIDLTSAVEAKTETTGGQPKPSGQVAVVPSGTQINEFPLVLNVAGTYDSFKKFLLNLERGIRLIDIQEISFTAADKTEVFEFSLRAKTYYQ